MSYPENLHFVDKEDAGIGSFEEINTSSELNDLASKIVPRYLQEVCHAFVPKESKTKARLVDLVSAMGAMYKLIRLAGNNPVFVVQDHYSWESCDGFYFFIGSEQEIKTKLLKISEDSYKLKKNNYCY